MKVKPSSPVHRDHVRSFCGNVKSICGSMMFCENCRFFYATSQDNNLFARF